MKVALCISGLPRSFKRTSKYILNLLSRYEVNVFISTWDAKFNNGRSTANKNDGDLDEFRTIYNAKKFETETYDKRIEKKLREISGSKKLRDSAIAMFYKIYKCDHLRRVYEKSSNTIHDIVIRTRSDLIFENTIDEKEIDLILDVGGLLLRRDCIHNKNIDRTCIWDQFFIGTPQEAEIYSNTFLELTSLEKLVDKASPEKILKKHLELNNVNLVQSKIRYNVIRDKEIEQWR